MSIRRFLCGVAALVISLPCLAGLAESATQFGIRGIKSREPNCKTTANLARDANIGWNRRAIRWNQIVDDQGNFDWTTLDHYVQVTLNRSIQTILTLRSVHEIFAPGSGEIDLDYRIRITSFPPAPEYLEAYKEFVRRTVERYDGDGISDAHFVDSKKNIKYWQIENEVGVEPDTGSTFWYGSTPADYVDLFLVAYDVIKQTDPQAQVALSGFNHGAMTYGLEHDRSFLTEVLRMLNEAGGDFDLFDYHFYEDYRQAASVAATVNFYLNPYPAFRGKPLWVTETNVDKEQMDPYCTQQNCDGLLAGDLVKRFVILLHNGIEKIFWFKLGDADDAAWNVPMTPVDFGKCRGLTDKDFTPKPVYYTYKLLIDKIKNKALGNAPAVPGGVSVYKFGLSDLAVYVLWYDHPDGDSVDANVPLPWDRVLITHIITESGETEGETETAWTADGILHLTVDETPIFLQRY